MIQITETIEIDEKDIGIRPIYASGPGGQHINKNMTAIQLHFDITRIRGLSSEVQQRLIGLGGSRVNNDKHLVITARRYRSQERNRCDAFKRLFDLIRKATEIPKPRLKKSRSKAFHKARVAIKRHRGEKKRLRQRVAGDD